jgi:hypothetical protein
MNNEVEAALPEATRKAMAGVARSVARKLVR